MQKIEKWEKWEKWLLINLMFWSIFGYIFGNMIVYIIEGPPSDNQSVLPLHFTYLSVLAAILLSVCIQFKIIKNERLLSIFMLITTTMLTVTMLIFWTLMFPGRASHMSAISIINTTIVHAVVPILMLAYAWVAVSLGKTIKLSYKKHWFLTPLPAIIFITYQQILLATSRIAIYNIFDYNVKPLGIVLVYIFSIATICFICGAGLIFANNKIKAKKA